MNKIIFTLMLVLIAFTARTNASAADIGVGAMGWFSAWKMKQKDGDSNTKPAIMYGPVMTVGFDKTWSLSGVFLYGVFKMKNGNDPSYQDIRRFDADITLNRIMTPNVKVFGGAKVMNYSWNENGSGHHLAAGPALGVGLSYPISDSFFILYNLSAMILRGTRDDSDGTRSFWAPGYNTTLSGAYYFASISTTLNTGLRLQYFKDIYNDSKGNDSHYFYGVFISAVYSF